MQATRMTDCCTGHDSCAAVPLVEASEDVFINSLGAGRVGDHYSPHGCIVHPSHPDNIAEGSPDVFINGKPAGRVGDSVSIGGSVRDGSSNVFIN